MGLLTSDILPWAFYLFYKSSVLMSHLSPGFFLGGGTGGLH